MIAARVVKPIPVGISSVHHDGVTAWAIHSTDPMLEASAVIDGITTPSAVGTGYLAAFENLLKNPTLYGRPVDLYVDSDEFRDTFDGLSSAFGKINVQHESCSLGRAARRSAQALILDFPEEVATTPPTPLPRLTVATDGSAGGASKKKRGTGSAWVDESGAHGYAASPFFKQAIEAELDAIRLALSAHKSNQPLLILCDSQVAVTAVRSLIEGEPLDSLLATATTKSRNILIAIHDLLRGRDIKIQWVKGHAANIYNLTADRLAVGVRRTMQMNLLPSAFKDVAARIVDEVLSNKDEAEAS
jgi:ribonuclease HI